MAAYRQEVLLRHLLAVGAETLESNTVAGDEGTKVSSRVHHEVAYITLNNPPVNAFHPSLARDLETAVKQAYGNPLVKALVISGNKTFMAGADIAYMQANQVKGNQAAMRAYMDSSNNLLNLIEDGPKPVVAAIAGFAFGGGLELAMACNSRLALPTAQVGLPELTLGLIPGFGGTQRLPRLVGVPKALEMILKSESLKAPQAAQLGLVDGIIDKEEALLTRASELALDIAAGRKPRNRAMFKTDKLQNRDEIATAVDVARKAAARQVDLPHVSAAVEAVALGTALPTGIAGLREESRLFMSICLSESARALVHLFLAKRLSSKVPGISASVKPSKMRRFGVVGGGLMGIGIAAALVMAGAEKVIVKEAEPKFLEAAKQRVVSAYPYLSPNMGGLFQGRLKRGALTQAAYDRILNQVVQLTVAYEDFRDVDCAIEAVFENIPLKQQIFVDLEKHCPKHALLATNTSTIDIDVIGAKTKAQERIIGLHFFSPAHIMPLLEIVRPPSTGQQAVVDSLALTAAMRKTPIVVGNCPGFCVNRIFFPYFQSAMFLVDVGIDPYRIDKALMKFGMPMGVFRLADMVGVDIMAHTSKTYFDAYPTRTYASPLFTLMMDAKRYGDKSKAGFYKHEDGKALPDPALQALISTSRAKSGRYNAQKSAHVLTQGFSVTDAELVEMVLYPVVNESCRVLEERMVLRASDIDVGAVLGYNWPAYRGGPMFWGNRIGSAKIAAKLAAWTKQLNQPLFAPCERLQAGGEL